MNEPVANVEQAAAWNGDDGRDWTEYEAQFNATLLRQTPYLMDAASIQMTDRVLDVGCGCGETTRLAGRSAWDGHAHGIDLSGPMLERAAAHAQAEGLTNVTFEQGDAQVHPFTPDSYDVAISRYGAMFFGDQAAAFRNIARALQPGGRIAILTWQPLDLNPWMQAIRQALAAGRELPTPPAGGVGPF